MKKIVSIILAVIILMSFAGCGKQYTQKDLDDAYSKGWKECGKHLASLEPSWEDEWQEVYDRGYADGLNTGKKSSSTKTEYVYTGNEDAKESACSHIDDARSYLGSVERDINHEDYDGALSNLYEAQEEISDALEILGY